MENIAEPTLLIVPMQSLLSSIDRYRPPNPTPSAAQSQLNDEPVSPGIGTCISQWWLRVFSLKGFAWPRHVN